MHPVWVPSHRSGQRALAWMFEWVTVPAPVGGGTKTSVVNSNTPPGVALGTRCGLISIRSDGRINGGDSVRSNTKLNQAQTRPAQNYARPGDVKFLYRHYANGENPTELGFFGAEAAAEQATVYTYLFFRISDQADGLGSIRTSSIIAAASEGLNFPEWEKTLEMLGGANGPIAERLKGYEDLAAAASASTSPGGDRRPPTAAGRFRTRQAWPDRTGHRRSAVGPARSNSEPRCPPASGRCIRRQPTREPRTLRSGSSSAT